MCSTVISATPAVRREATSNRETVAKPAHGAATSSANGGSKDEHVHDHSRKIENDRTTTSASNSKRSSVYMMHHQGADEEHGVDDDFLNALVQIAASNEGTTSPNEQEYYETNDTMNDTDEDMDLGGCDGSVNLHHDYQSHLISPPSSPLTVPLTSLSLPESFDENQNNAGWTVEMDLDVDLPLNGDDLAHLVVADHEAAGNDVASFSSSVSTPLIQAPTSIVDGFINAYMVVDPVSKIVFLPRQVLTCMVPGTDSQPSRMESIEFGPLFLPSFDTNVIQSYTDQVVAQYHQNNSCTISTDSVVTEQSLHHEQLGKDSSISPCSVVSSDYL